MNLFTNRKRLTDLEKWTYGCQGEGLGEGIVGDFGKIMCTLLYLKWITNKDLLCNTRNSAQCYVPAWIGGACGGEWILTREEGTVLEMLACCVPLFPGKAIKLFFLLHNSVSIFLFVIGAQRAKVLATLVGSKEHWGLFPKAKLGKIFPKAKLGKF